MVASLVLVRDNNGDLHDQEGHLRNAAGERIDAQGAAIPEPDATAIGTTLPVDEAAQPKTLADYKRENVPRYEPSFDRSWCAEQEHLRFSLDRVVVLPNSGYGGISDSSSRGAS